MKGLFSSGSDIVLVVQFMNVAMMFWNIWGSLWSGLSYRHREIYQEKFHKALQNMETANGAMRSTVIQAFKKILDSLMFTGYEAHRSERLFEKHVQTISPCGFAAILLNLVLGCQ